MKRVSLILAAVVIAAVFAGSASSQERTANEQAVWKLERAYWGYVQALDLDSYKKLWHPNFVGWPNLSARPARKDHITDWITTRSDKGERLQSFKLVEADSQATENLVETHYWLTSTWAGKDASPKTSTIRVSHTWIRTPAGWQIIGGMSAPEPNPVP